MELQVLWVDWGLTFVLAVTDSRTSAYAARVIFAAATTKVAGVEMCRHPLVMMPREADGPCKGDDVTRVVEYIFY